MALCLLKLTCCIICCASGMAQQLWNKSAATNVNYIFQPNSFVAMVATCLPW